MCVTLSLKMMPKSGLTAKCVWNQKWHDALLQSVQGCTTGEFTVQAGRQVFVGCSVTDLTVVELTRLCNLSLTPYRGVDAAQM